MYWAVVGAFVAFEYVTGWILDWCVPPFADPRAANLTVTVARRVPFYWEARTVFLLFLSLLPFLLKLLLARA